MRIVHISDIHLSKNNFTEFENNYRKTLLQTLKHEHAITNIDIIAISGDLVDQGGHSLYEIPRFNSSSDPFIIFEEEFIKPLKQALDLDNSNFLFVPGNHDINENEILWVDEKKQQDLEVDGKIDSQLRENKLEFNHSNKRIELFKNFEQRFHRDTDNYTYSNNESTYIYEFNDEIKIGFALINDSWRCSTCHLHKHKDKKLYFGNQQLYQALQTLEASNTVFNIILTHHPLKSYGEEEEIFRVITHREYHLHLFGDKHNHNYDSYITTSGSCFGIMARAALNKPDEPASKWQPGFHIIDINLYTANIEKITYYKYIHDRCTFARDSDTAPPDGYDNNKHKLSFVPVEKIIKINKDNLDKTKFFRS